MVLYQRSQGSSGSRGASGLPQHPHKPGDAHLRQPGEVNCRCRFENCFLCQCFAPLTFCFYSILFYVFICVLSMYLFILCIGHQKNLSAFFLNNWNL